MSRRRTWHSDPVLSDNYHQLSGPYATPDELATHSIELDSVGEGSPTTSSSTDDAGADQSELSPGEVADDEALVDYLLREGLMPTDVPVSRATLPCIVAYLKNNWSPYSLIAAAVSSPTSPVFDLESLPTSRLGAEWHQSACEHENDSSWPADRRIPLESDRLCVKECEPPLQSSPEDVGYIVDVTSSVVAQKPASLDDYATIPTSDEGNDVHLLIGDNDPLLKASWSSSLCTSSNWIRSPPVPPAMVEVSSAAFVALEDCRQRTYSCAHWGCGRVYDNKSGLAAHSRRHNGERPFRCSTTGCTWSFSRSDELARHERSHSGIRPYPCPLCDKRFVRSDHLANHRKVHGKRCSMLTAIAKVNVIRRPDNVS